MAKKYFADNFIKSGGTVSQFLKADGSVDSSVYSLDSNVVHRTGSESIFIDNTGGIKTFNNTSTNNPSILLLNSSSAPGLSSTNSSTGTIIHLSNMLSGNGIVVNGASASTGLIYVGQNAGINTFTVNKLGTVTGSSFIKSGATSTNILLAGGTDIPQSTFAPASGGTGYIQNQNAVLQTASLWINGIAAFEYDMFIGIDKGIWFKGKTDYTGSGVTGRNSGNEIGIFTTGSERLRINSLGNVGIGTTNHSAKLEVVRSGSGILDTMFLLNNHQTIGVVDGVRLKLRDFNIESSSTYGSTNNILTIGVNTSKQITLLQNGNVGINTLTPVNKFAVGLAPGTGGGITLQNTSSSEYARFGIIDPTVNNDTFIGSMTNNNFLLYTVNSERMRITAAGNVLIGTNIEDGNYKLEVAGNTAIYGELNCQNSLQALQLTSLGNSYANQFILNALDSDFASNAFGVVGEIKISTNYIYVCTAASTWKRVALSTF